MNAMAHRHGAVFGAFAYLQAVSLYNNVRQRLLRLKQPKYLVGAVVGDAMGDPRRYGLDAAAAAAFCALLWPRLKSKDAVAIAALAALIAVLVAPHAPAGVPVLVAACTALLAGLWQRAHHDPPPPHRWPDQTSADAPGGAP